MELTTPINLNLLEKLKKRSYFHKFFLARAKDEIAEQIRHLRKLRKLNQAEFAKRAGMKQPAVSRIEQAEYAGWSFQTLARTAEVLDAKVQIIFTPMEDVINEYETAETERVVWRQNEMCCTLADNIMERMSLTTSDDRYEQLSPDHSSSRGDFSSENYASSR